MNGFPHSINCLEPRPSATPQGGLDGGIGWHLWQCEALFSDYLSPAALFLNGVKGDCLVRAW